MIKNIDEVKQKVEKPEAKNKKNDKIKKKASVHDQDEANELRNLIRFSGSF